MGYSGYTGSHRPELLRIPMDMSYTGSQRPELLRININLSYTGSNRPQLHNLLFTESVGIHYFPPVPSYPHFLSTETRWTSIHNSAMPELQEPNRFAAIIFLDLVLQALRSNLA